MSDNTIQVAGAATPQDTEELLEHNLTLADSSDMARGMFFNGALQVLLQHGGQEVAQRCLEASGERKHIDFFNYPVSGFLRMCLTASRLVGPRLGGCERLLRWVGMQSAKDFLSSLAGKTALLLAGSDVRRLLNQLPPSYRVAVSYGERNLLWTGERSGRFFMKRDFMPPAYHEGILLGSLESAGIRNAQVRGRLLGPLDSEYTLSWER